MNKALNDLSILALAAPTTASLAMSAGAAGPVVVTNGNDSGEGSLRAALQAVAKEDGPAQILIETNDDIEMVIIAISRSLRDSCPRRTKTSSRTTR